MVYSDVVNGGLILPGAARYTIRHYKQLRRQGFSIARALAQAARRAQAAIKSAMLKGV